MLDEETRGRVFFLSGKEVITIQIRLLNLGYIFLCIYIYRSRSISLQKSHKNLGSCISFNSSNLVDLNAFDILNGKKDI